MIDIIIALIIFTALVCAVIFVYKSKKNGKACMGCPNYEQCKSDKCNK